MVSDKNCYIERYVFILHSAELKNAVTVTQNGITFLLVWIPLGFWAFVSGSAHDQLSLSDFILDYLCIFLLNAMLNFLWYLYSSKHSGSQFELHTHFHLLVVINL